MRPLLRTRALNPHHHPAQSALGEIYTTLALPFILLGPMAPA